MRTSKELHHSMRRPVHRPGQINVVAIAAATILKAGLASHRQGRRLAARASSRSVINACAAELRRPGHATASHSKLTFAVRPVADDRRHLVGEDPRKQQLVAPPIVLRAKPIANRRLAFGQTVERLHIRRV